MKQEGFSSSVSEENSTKSQKLQTVLSFLIGDWTVTLESLLCVNSFTADMVSATGGVIVHQSCAFNEGTFINISCIMRERESRKKSGNHFVYQKEGLFQDPPGNFRWDRSEVL